MTLLNKLSMREKVLIISGGAVLLMCALWFYVWQPLEQQRSVQESRIARYLAVLNLTDQFEPISSDFGTQCTPTMALGPRVTQSAEAFGMPLTRLDPEGNRLRITVAETSYIDAMTWIADLEVQSCVRIIIVEMNRLSQPGLVSLRTTLEEAR